MNTEPAIRLLSSLALIAPVAAMAQTSGGVIVMRRQISTGTFQLHGWRAGDWTFVSAAAQCSATASMRRAVTCVRNDSGDVVDDGMCNPSIRPASSDSAERLDGCRAGWTAGNWSDWSSSCGPASRTRTVTCSRRDATTGTPFAGATPEGMCDAATKPDVSEMQRVTAGCTNLVVNGDFETDDGSWYYGGGRGTPGIRGAHSGIIANTGHPADDAYTQPTLMIQPIRVTVGQTYTLTYNFAVLAGSACPQRFEGGFYDNNFNPYARQATSGCANGSKSVTWTATATREVYIQFKVFGMSGKQATMMVDDVVLTLDS